MIYLFIVLEIAIYITFLFLDIIDYSDYLLINRIKYAGVIMCFIFVIFFYGKSTLTITLLQVGMFSTLLADSFLLLTEYEEYGMFAFVFTHYFYMVKLTYEHQVSDNYNNRNELNKILLSKIIRSYLFIAINTFILSVVFYLVKIPVDLLFVLTCIYFQSILCNVVLSIRNALSEPRIYDSCIFAIGMILFLFCDINVGIYNMTQYLVLDNDIYLNLYKISSVAMWFFYLPSQVLIALSCFGKGCKDT